MRSNDFVVDMIHNMEELAELQQAISKWVRSFKENNIGIDEAKKRIREELTDVYVAIDNLKEWLDYGYVISERTDSPIK